MMPVVGLAISSSGSCLRRKNNASLDPLLLGLGRKGESGRYERETGIMLSSYFDIIHGPQGIDSTSSKQAPAVTEVASVVWISGLWTEYDAASAIDPGASVCFSFATWKPFV